MHDVLLVVLLFLLGGCAYMVLEWLWRGHTHWSMAVTGGIAFVLLYGLYSKFDSMGVLYKCLVGASVITALEFVCGALVNVRLKWQVWDYSSFKYNLYGQICLRYSLLWAALCIPITYLVHAINLIRFP